MERGQVDTRAYKLDLHIHTVLSPCTEIGDMTPRAIVRTAREKGLDMIAICDHNSARNVAATGRAARSSGLTVVPGMEVTSSEEIHILGLFPSDEAAEAMQEEVYSRLFGQNNEDVFGFQVVVDEEDGVDDLDQRLLIGATTMPAEKVAGLIHELGGLAIAAHVDRQAFGVFSQLGFIPETLDFDALEVSRRSDYMTVRDKYRQSREYTLTTASDAHYLEDIGAVYTTALLAAPTFEELRMALAGERGRRIVEEPS